MFLHKTILGITSYLLTTNGQDAMSQKLEIWDLRNSWGEGKTLFKKIACFPLVCLSSKEKRQKLNYNWKIN